jgi:hypothetical protein
MMPYMSWSTYFASLVLKFGCFMNGHQWTDILDDTVLQKRTLYKLCEKCGKVVWIR